MQNMGMTSLPFQSAGLTCEGLSRSTFSGPSWDDPLTPTLLLERSPSCASGRSSLPAPLPAEFWSETRGSLALLCRWRSVLWFLPFHPSLAGSPERLGPPSRSPIPYAPAPRVAPNEKCVIKPVDNGDIGNNNWNRSRRHRIAVESGELVRLLHPADAVRDLDLDGGRKRVRIVQRRDLHVDLVREGHRVRIE